MKKGAFVSPSTTIDKFTSHAYIGELYNIHEYNQYKAKPNKHMYIHCEWLFAWCNDCTLEVSEFKLQLHLKSFIRINELCKGY